MNSHVYSYTSHESLYQHTVPEHSQFFLFHANSKENLALCTIPGNVSSGTVSIEGESVKNGGLFGVTEKQEQKQILLDFKTGKKCVLCTIYNCPQF